MNFNKIKFRNSRFFPNTLLHIIQFKYLVLLCFIFAPIVSNAYATTYYIDYLSGSDNNNGTISDPWKHCPGDSRAIGNANIILSPGDTVVFKGGVIYSFDSVSVDYLSANSSGSSGSEINYTSGHLHSTPWPNSNDRAVIDGTNADLDYSNNRTGVISLRNYSYIIVKGLEVKNQSTVNNYIAEIGWKGNSGGNIKIENCILHNGGGCAVIFQGVWNDPSPASNPSNFAVTDCTIYDHNFHGILTRAGIDNVTIENCTIHDGGKEIYTGQHEGDGIFSAKGGTSELDTLTIRGCTIYDHPIKGHCLIMGDNLLIENNYAYDGDDGTAFGFAVAANDGGTSSNVIIRNNVVVGIYRYDGLLRFNMTGTGSCVIDGLKIYNNTLVGYGAGNIIWFSKGNSTANPAITNVTIKNNVLDTTANTKNVIEVEEAETGHNFTVDYNHYDYGTMGNPFYWQGTARNLTYWQSTLGFDTFSHTQNTDPGLTSDFKPASGSPLIDAGITLGSFSTDKEGVLRPQEYNWDIGAYEPEQHPVPPSNLKIISP